MWCFWRGTRYSAEESNFHLQAAAGEKLNYFARSHSLKLCTLAKLPGFIEYRFSNSMDCGVRWIQTLQSSIISFYLGQKRSRKERVSFCMTCECEFAVSREVFLFFFLGLLLNRWFLQVPPT
jgi:hypothetical protein